MIKNNILWLAVIILCEASALYFVKKYSVNNDLAYLLILSMISYAIIPIFLYKMLKNGGEISIINTIWNIASTLYGLFIGVILFGEFVTLQQKIGIVFGTIGIFLMN
jgi:multidrug transporter EmrE-like cation transporter